MKTRALFIPLTLAFGLTLVLALLWIANTQAARAEAYSASDLHVCPTCTYTTIQAAVDAAEDGDTIKIAAGTYMDAGGEVVNVHKSVTLIGGYAPPDWDTSNPAANPTIVDGQDDRVGVYVGANYTVTLRGLRIVNGAGGGVYRAMYAAADSRLTIKNCDILSSTNDNQHGGGGIFVYGGSLVVDNSRIISNTAGGIGASGGGIYARGADVRITRSTIRDNFAISMGGGAWIYECTAYLADNTFSDNRSGWNGGGLESTWGNIILDGNMFLNNAAEGHGGGIGVGGIGEGNVYTLTNNLIQGNNACPDCQGVGGGASIANGRGWVDFNYNHVISNTASGGSKGTGGGVYLSGPARAEGNLIQDNLACAGLDCIAWGGGMALGGDIWLVGNRILNNRGQLQYDWWTSRGGGIAIGIQDHVTLTNNIIAGNHYSDRDLRGDDGGGAIYIGGQTSSTETWAILHHNTIAENQSPAILSESAGLELSHNIFANQDTDIRALKDSSGLGPLPTTVLDYTLWWPAMVFDAQDGSVIETKHNFTGDPRFLAFGLDDYHLGPGSAAIDRGQGVGVVTDIDGSNRPMGFGFDLGADEMLSIYLPLIAK